MLYSMHFKSLSGSSHLRATGFGPDLCAHSACSIKQCLDEIQRRDLYAHLLEVNLEEVPALAEIIPSPSLCYPTPMLLVFHFAGVRFVG